MDALETLRVSANESDLIPGCDGLPTRPSCVLTPSEAGVWDMIAGLRMVISCLSLLGTSSIIGSAIKKREVTHAKVHPIVALALSDLLLALLWIVGGGMWLRGVGNRNWCFVVSLLTVILVCVSVNLTVVYALITYSIIKKTDVIGTLANMDSSSQHGWPSTKTVLVYSIAWGLPVLIVLSLFAVVAGSSEIVENANSCSCWCAPLLGNVLPYAIHRQEGTARFVHGMRKLLVVYGVIVSSHFLVGLIVLCVLYTKVLKWIRNLKNSYTTSSEPRRTSYTYGSSDQGQHWALLSRGESKARKRVFYFLAVFIVNGFFNFILALGIMSREIIAIQETEPISSTSDFRTPPFESFYIIFGALQAVSITQQGFLNAIVYGWTRETFVHVMAFSSRTGDSLGLLSDGARSTDWGRRGTESGELGATWDLRAEGEGKGEEEEEGEDEGEDEQNRPLYETS